MKLSGFYKNLWPLTSNNRKYLLVKRSAPTLRKSMATILKPLSFQAARVSTKAVLLFKRWGSAFSSGVTEMRLPSADPKIAAVTPEVKRGEDW